MKILSFIFLLLSPTLFIADPIVEWLSPLEHDFGDLEKDKPVEHFFKFKNISEAPITIDNVRTSCGCTAPDWSLVPVEGGATDQLRIEFDAAKPGYFRKRIKVYFNSQRKAEIMYIEGFVLEE
ncbi:MAG: hypothetical protein ACI8VT_004188 [Saprospiraceae bacterium]|jgi:hypothetical protein